MPRRQRLYLIIFFIGWLLSPLSWWNDAFINLPIAWITASLFYRRHPSLYLGAALATYWLTNILGMIIMIASGKKMWPKHLAKVKVKETILIIVIYSIALTMLIYLKILKPWL